MFFDIKTAEYQSEYRIRLGFEDGSVGVVDFSIYLDENNIFKSFFDMDYFKNFKIEYGVLVWGEGELDLAPETLYEKVTGKHFSYKPEKSVV